MPLSQTRLEGKIKELIENNPGGDQGVDYFAKNLAAELVAEVRQATITVPSGIAVQVTPNTGTGATTASTTASIE